MLDSLSSQAATAPVFAHLWTSLLAFMLSMGLVALLTWILTGRTRLQQEVHQEPEEIVITVELIEQPLQQAEETELWRSRLEHLYLDVPAVDPRKED